MNLKQKCHFYVKVQTDNRDGRGQVDSLFTVWTENGKRSKVKFPLINVHLLQWFFITYLSINYRSSTANGLSPVGKIAKKKNSLKECEILLFGDFAHLFPFIPQRRNSRSGWDRLVRYLLLREGGGSLSTCEKGRTR